MHNVVDLKMAAAGDEQNPDAPRYTFTDFWTAYPKRVAKKDAQKAWLKIRAEDYQPIFAALAMFKKSEDWRKESGRYIPLPASWLNGERWTDELEADLTMGECMWNVNDNREPGKGKCRRGAVKEKNGIVYCASHIARVN